MAENRDPATTGSTVLQLAQCIWKACSSNANVGDRFR